MNDGKGVRKDSVRGEVLSSDDEQEATKVPRPRQRSLRRKKYSFTNQLTSEQLVSKCVCVVCMCVCVCWLLWSVFQSCRWDFVVVRL